MKKILNVISSPRGEASYSNKLGNAIIEQLKNENPGSTVVTRDLNKEQYPHVETAHIAAFFTPPENRSAENLEAIKQSDEATRELLEADTIVINIPMWNFSVPSSLKAWIDHISRVGVTFKYSEKGPVGLVSNKKVYIAIASGGIYSEGPAKAVDFVEPYMRSFLGFLGMTDVSVYRVEGVSIPGIMETALDKAIGSITGTAVAA